MSRPNSGGPGEPTSGGRPARATDNYRRGEYLTEDYADYDAEYDDYAGESADSRRWRWLRAGTAKRPRGTACG